MRLSSMEYFGLNKTFKDAGFFETSYHANLIKEIRSAIHNGSLIAVSGIVGSGKTALLRQIQNILIEEGQIIVSKSLMVEKEKVNLTALITALYYDLATKKEVKIPFQGERRERELQEHIRNRKKPVVLFVDEAHAVGVYGDDGSGLIHSAGIDDDVLLSAQRIDDGCFRERPDDIDVNRADLGVALLAQIIACCLDIFRRTAE